MIAGRVVFHAATRTEVGVMQVESKRQEAVVSCDEEFSGSSTEDQHRICACSRWYAAVAYGRVGLAQAAA